MKNEASPIIDSGHNRKKYNAAKERMLILHIMCCALMLLVPVCCLRKKMEKYKIVVI